MIFAGIIIGIVIASIGWGIFAWHLNNKWADICRKINHDWATQCHNLIDYYWE